MQKNKIPKTCYEDLADYTTELKAIYMSTLWGNQFLSNFQEISEEKIHERLNNEVFKLKKKYRDKLNEDDYYQFESLNKLEEFLLETKLFPMEKVNKSVLEETERIFKAIENGMYGLWVGCWLTIDNRDKIDYSINIKIGFKNLEEINNNYTKFISEKEQDILKRLYWKKK